MGADDCEVSSFLLLFLRVFHHNYFAIGDIFEVILGYVALVYVLHCFGAWDVSDSVGEVS
jgi:hypothetical protein